MTVTFTNYQHLYSQCLNCRRKRHLTQHLSESYLYLHSANWNSYECYKQTVTELHIFSVGLPVTNNKITVTRYFIQAANS